MTPEELEALKAEFAALSDADLSARYETARTRGAELAAIETHDEAQAAEFATVVAEAPLLRDLVEERTAAAAAAQANRDMFASLPQAAIPAVIPAAAPQAPAVEPTAVQKSDEPDPVPSVSQMAVQSPEPPAGSDPSDKVTVRTELSHAARGLLGMREGDTFSGNDQVGLALIKNAQSFGRRGAPGQRQTIAQFRRTRPHVVDTENGPETMKILREARDERRLSGGSLARQWQQNVEKSGSLTAAAGWCAPSENDYDLCRNWDSPVGLLDLPTVTVTRGGINYTDEPSFPEIYANAVAVGGGSNFLTEAQVIADTPKTCSEIPCPTFENRRLDVMALCIRVSFLQAAGYPEVVDAWDAGLRAAHEAEMNRIIIADIIARAGAATVIDGFGATDDSWTSGLLSSVDLAAEDIRYRFHMDWNRTVEVVLPHWVLPQIRADLSRRTRETMGMLSVSDAEIASLFSARNIRVQFVRGWQDGLITGGALVPTFPGGIATPPFLTALPNTVNFLAFPAGSVAVARQDVVTLTNVYDAASLAVNEFTSLFAEEGFAPIYPCPGQRLYTVNDLCPAGLVGAAQTQCSAIA